MHGRAGALTAVSKSNSPTTKGQGAAASNRPVVAKRTGKPKKSRTRANSSISVASVRSVRSRRLSATSLASAYAGGDFEDELEDGDGKNAKKDKRKAYLICIFIAHSVISFCFFAINVGVWVVGLTSEMKYFVRRANYFSVVRESSSVIIEFLIGALLHFLSSTYAVFCVRGWRRNAKFVLKYRDRVLISLICIATLGEILLLDSGFKYFANFPVVYNGAFENAALPPEPKDLNCVSLVLLRPSSHEDNQQVRVNLRWMTDVNCVVGMKLLEKAFDIKEKTHDCNELKHQLIQLVHSDCQITNLLLGCHYSYILMDILGLCFCGSLLYLYVKAVVKTRPVRFSLIPIPAEEIQGRLEASERLKQFATQMVTKTEVKANETHNKPVSNGGQHRYEPQPQKAKETGKASSPSPSTTQVEKRRSLPSGPTARAASSTGVTTPTRTGSNPAVNNSSKPGKP